jgi:hypothetical protein
MTARVQRIEWCRGCPAGPRRVWPRRAPDGRLGRRRAPVRNRSAGPPRARGAAGDRRRNAPSRDGQTDQLGVRDLRARLARGRCGRHSSASTYSAVRRVSRSAVARPPPWSTLAGHLRGRRWRKQRRPSDTLSLSPRPSRTSARNGITHLGGEPVGGACRHRHLLRLAERPCVTSEEAGGVHRHTAVVIDEEPLAEVDLAVAPRAGLGHRVGHREPLSVVAVGGHGRDCPDARQEPPSPILGGGGTLGRL